MDKRYVNVVGGKWGRVVERDDGTRVRVGMDACLATAVRELDRAGFGSDRVKIVPGPLIRATIGGGKEASHMPLDPKSTYNSLHELLDEAHRLANRSSPDPELDCPGGEPLWGHHSFRRFADTVARQTMAETGATEQDIDLTFGWLEAMDSQKMQIHYESKFVREKRKAVTSKV